MKQTRINTFGEMINILGEVVMEEKSENKDRERIVMKKIGMKL